MQTASSNSNHVAVFGDEQDYRVMSAYFGITPGQLKRLVKRLSGKVGGDAGKVRMRDLNRSVTSRFGIFTPAANLSPYGISRGNRRAQAVINRTKTARNNKAATKAK